MRLAQESAEHSGSTTTGPEFLTPAGRAARCQQLAKLGYLVARVVQLEEPAPEVETTADVEPDRRFEGNLPRSGQLREAVEGAVELALALRGAPPTGVDDESDAHTAALDKLVRAQVVDAPGMCVLMPPLAAMTDDDGVLVAADSEVLRTWHGLATSQPISLLFDEADRDVQALAPRKLATLFDQPAPWVQDHQRLPDALSEEGPDEPTPTDRCAAVAWAEPAANGAELPMDLAFEPTTDEELGREAEDAPAVAAADAPLGEDPSAARHAATLGRLFEELLPKAPDPEPAFFEMQLDGDDEYDEQVVAREQEPLAEPPVSGGLFDVASSSPDAGAGQPLDEQADLRDERSESAPPRRGSHPKPGPDPDRVRPPRRSGRLWRAGKAAKSSPESEHRLDADTCTKYARELEQASGPQPVRTIEQLFRTRYMPLIEALSCGLVHEPARQATAQWRRGFEKSYSDGYTAMRLTGKRPPMVLDGPEHAVRLGRLNGARSAQLLLIDSMRFDLGERVMRQLRHHVHDRAVCVDEALLWSALPTITPTQMRLLARGPRGLREGEPMSDRDAQIHRGRSVTTLRRVRIGHRDLLKLDVVEARLREAGPAFDDRMSDLAEEVATVLAKLIRSSSPRTLLYVFGDHGFRLQAGADDGDGAEGTLPAAQGGSTPEEVLVPAYAWLVGDVH